MKPHTDSHERARKRRTALIFVGLLIGVPALAFLVYKVTIGRPVLVGVDHHDFGTFTVASESAELHHTFRLRNRLDEPIEITAGRASCGCVAPVLPDPVIAPGATVEIPVTLTLARNRTGRKSESLTLIMRDRGARVMTLEAEVLPAPN